jgi:UDP-N-acetyl-D-glucosamine dehydrogenase
MPDYVVQRLTMALNRSRRSVNGSKILLLGLAYKRNTGDARQSPALAVAERLLSLGADVRAADPYVDEDQVDRRIARVEATIEEVAAMDAVVILTDHDAFGLDRLAPHASYLLDTRHCVSPSATVEYL